MIMETKVCSKCGRELPTGEFYRNANTKDGLQSCCRACSNKMAAESHRRKANKVKEQLKKLDAMEAKQKPVEQPKHKVYTNPVLAPITPRELMLELKARGYEGELVFKEIKMTEHRINLSRLD